MGRKRMVGPRAEMLVILCFVIVSVMEKRENVCRKDRYVAKVKPAKVSKLSKYFRFESLWYPKKLCTFTL
jgi:hypothetical protein